MLDLHEQMLGIVRILVPCAVLKESAIAVECQAGHMNGIAQLVTGQRVATTNCVCAPLFSAQAPLYAAEHQPKGLHLNALNQCHMEKNHGLLEAEFAARIDRISTNDAHCMLNHGARLNEVSLIAQLHRLVLHGRAGDQLFVGRVQHGNTRNAWLRACDIVTKHFNTDYFRCHAQLAAFMHHSLLWLRRQCHEESVARHGDVSPRPELGSGCG